MAGPKLALVEPIDLRFTIDSRFDVILRLNSFSRTVFKFNGATFVVISLFFLIASKNLGLHVLQSFEKSPLSAEIMFFRLLQLGTCKSVAIFSRSAVSGLLSQSGSSDSAKR